MIDNINNTTSTTTTPNVDPGYTFETAFDLGVADNGLIVNESVGGNDAGDVYSFSVNQAGLYNLSLDGLVADADLMLVDAQQQVIDFSIAESNESELISAQLAPGNYYAIAETYDGGATSYTLSISNGALTTSPDTETTEFQTGNIITPQADPGYTFDTAWDLGIADDGLTVSETVGGTDAGDIFAFTINEGSLYNVSLDGMTADTDLVLTDAQGQAIDMSQMVGSQGELISAQLTPGNYYAIAQSYDGLETNYTLSITDAGMGLDNELNNGGVGQQEIWWEPGAIDDWWNGDWGITYQPDYPNGGIWNQPDLGGGFIPDNFGGGFAPDYTPGGIGGGIDHETFIQEVIWEREEVFDPNTNTTTWVDTTF